MSPDMIASLKKKPQGGKNFSERGHSMRPDVPVLSSPNMFIAHRMGACMYIYIIHIIYLHALQCKPSCLWGLLIRVAPFTYQEQPYIYIYICVCVLVTHVHICVRDDHDDCCSNFSSIVLEATCAI